MTETQSAVQKYQAEITACRRRPNEDYYLATQIDQLITSAQKEREFDILLNELRKSDPKLAAMIMIRLDSK